MLRQAESARLPINGLSPHNDGITYHAGTRNEDADIVVGNEKEEENIGGEKPDSGTLTTNEGEEGQPTVKTKAHGVQIWTEVRLLLHPIEDAMSFRVKTTAGYVKKEQGVGTGKHLPPIEEARPAKGASEEESEDEFYDLESSESTDNISALGAGATGDLASPESLIPWKEELEILVQGGVPMALRGEVDIPVFDPSLNSFNSIFFLYAQFVLLIIALASLCWCQDASCGEILSRFASIKR